MEVVLVIHIFLALAIIGLVLLQRSEGGGLGIGGNSGGGIGGLATAQGAADVLTKATTFCAAAFFCTSLLLGILSGTKSSARHGILDELDNVTPAVAIEIEIDESDLMPPTAPLSTE